MKQHILFRQYAWLLDTISRAGKITFEEINSKWRTTEMSDGLDLPRATFNRHRNNIEEMFGIFIECDRKNGYTYSIGNPEDLQTSSIQQWLTNTLSATSLIIGYQGLHRRILLEEVPSSFTFLETILSAIQRNCCVEIIYQKFLDSESHIYRCEPYCLKLYRRRWYLLANVSSLGSASLRVYALDRIKDCKLIEEMHFVMEDDFDANDFFRDYFGVLLDKSQKAETIRLRVFGKQVSYLRTLPLHPSQKEITQTGQPKDYSDFEFHLVPTNDFIAELISKNAWVEVLEPQSLREKMIEEIGYLQKRYGIK